jgi:hypothetical protein
MINGIGGDFREMSKKHEKAENNDKIFIKNGFFDGIFIFWIETFEQAC